MDNGRGSPKYGFAVVGMTALDFGHNFAQVGLFSSAILTSPQVEFCRNGPGWDAGPSSAQGIVAPLPFVETCSLDSFFFGGDSFFSLFFPYIFRIILIS